MSTTVLSTEALLEDYLFDPSPANAERLRAVPADDPLAALVAVALDPQLPPLPVPDLTPLLSLALAGDPLAARMVALSGRADPLLASRFAGMRAADVAWQAWALREAPMDASLVRRFLTGMLKATDGAALLQRLRAGEGRDVVWSVLMGAPQLWANLDRELPDADTETALRLWLVQVALLHVLRAPVPPEAVDVPAFAATLPIVLSVGGVERTLGAEVDQEHLWISPATPLQLDIGAVPGVEAWVGRPVRLLFGMGAVVQAEGQINADGVMVLYPTPLLQGLCALMPEAQLDLRTLVSGRRGIVLRVDLG